MKYHPLALMIAIVLAQGCSSQHKEQQAELLPAPSATQVLTDKKDSAQQDMSVEEAKANDLSSQVMTNEVTVKEQIYTKVAKQKAERRANYAAGAANAPSTMVIGKMMAIAPASEAMMDSYHLPKEERDKFEHFNDSPIKQVDTDPVSTFSLDVDTGSYALVRQFIQQGRLPASDAVRVEELINYFSYQYPKATGQHPFATETELSTAPWQPEHYLLRIGVQAQDVHVSAMPPANLVFLVDVSGSMDELNKLPLVISSLQMLTQQLRPQDKVSLVVYAGRTEVVLEPTAGNKKADIQAALGRLQAGGSTAGASALDLAYKMARKGYVTNGINRILLATDGDFNVGVTDTNQIKDMVKRERESGITLSTLGFGQGNFNDAMMEQIADVGNGNYSYIDSLNEARKVLVDELSSTFNTIAKDVKVQIEFNPNVVAEYRLIGYENRQLNREDFNNDKVDAGDVGSGKSVTAIYEITPKTATPAVDALRYQVSKAPSEGKKANDSQELAFLKIRYKQPEGTKSILVTQPIANPSFITSFIKSSETQRFATAVAGFGQLLRQSPQVNALTYSQIVQIAQAAKGSDSTGSKGEFIQLVKNAESLAGKNTVQSQL
ncbi:MAG: VWA domain-containing protein [Agitococcus sp.]|nr:VWA domain-containing protein [Agitococcus sp.]